MPARHQRGFTLIELLVVIAIIVLLVGLVLVSLRGVRASAGRADSLGALRQIGLAYTQYSQDSSGQLLPGYVDAGLFATGQLFDDLEPVLPDGTVLAIPDRQSYVWRLAPYLDDAWQTFFADGTNRGVLDQFQDDFAQGRYGPAGGGSPNHPYIGNISERPAYGLNSIFLGGDSVHGGNQVTNRNPWTGSGGKIAATRLTEVKNPATLIIFAPAARALTNPPSGEFYDQPEAGFCELRPPYLVLDGPTQTWQLPQWKCGDVTDRLADFGSVQTCASGQYAAGAGLPIDRRRGGKIAVVNLDGSSSVEEIAALSRNMKRWNPDELAMRRTVEPD